MKTALDYFKEFLPERIATDSWILFLHRSITAMVLTIAWVVSMADALYQNNAFCYDIVPHALCNNYNAENCFKCDHDLWKWLFPFVFLYQAILVNVPYCVFFIGADKQPFKVLQAVQQLSSDKTASVGHLTHIICDDHLNDFLERYQQSADKLKRKSKMCCLLYQELLQFVVFIINYGLIQIILSQNYVFKSNASCRNNTIISQNVLVALIWIWYFLLFTISIIYISYRFVTFLCHKNKKFNKIYWKVKDEHYLDTIGRLDFADWLFFYYVKETTLPFFCKVVFKALEEREGRPKQNYKFK